MGSSKEVVSSNSKSNLQSKVNYLTDLDGLLVNSKSFNQLFIQRTDPLWIRSQLEKLTKSSIHFTKFIEVLTDFITSNLHPSATRNALIWLDYCFLYYTDIIQSLNVQQSLRKICSHYYQLSNLGNLCSKASNRGLAIECWANSTKSLNFLSHKLYYDTVLGLPSTNHIYVDGDMGSNDNKFSKFNMNKSDLSSVDEESVTDDSDYEEHSIGHYTESDAGVFDVNESELDQPFSLAGDDEDQYIGGDDDHDDDDDDSDNEYSDNNNDESESIVRSLQDNYDNPHFSWSNSMADNLSIFNSNNDDNSDDDDDVSDKSENESFSIFSNPETEDKKQSEKSNQQSVNMTLTAENEHESFEELISSTKRRRSNQTTPDFKKPIKRIKKS